MDLRKFTILILLSGAAGGCMRGDDYVALPPGHPAEPGGRSGAALGVSTALEPELRTVRAKVTPPAGQPEPSAPAAQDQQHQH